MIPKELNEKNYNEYISEARRTHTVYHAPSLNCLHFGITERHPRFWIGNIRQFFRNLKCAKQRIKYGYCDYDVWNMDSHLTLLLADMLDSLAINGMGYPGVDPYTSSKEWERDLMLNAKRLRVSEDDDSKFIENPFYDDYMEKLLNGDNINSNSTDEIKQNYLGAETTRYQKRVVIRNEALDWIKKYYSYLWD